MKHEEMPRELVDTELALRRVLGGTTARPSGNHVHQVRMALAKESERQRTRSDRDTWVLAGQVAVLSVAVVGLNTPVIAFGTFGLIIGWVHLIDLIGSLEEAV